MSGDLTLNKILGAALATGLIIMGAKLGSDMIYHPKLEKAEKPGYAIEVADTGGDTGAAAAVDTPPDWGTVLPAADIAAGEATFKKCESCHNNAQGGPNMTGPNLWGVVGRPTASHPGMSYSDAMMAHAKDSPAWTYDQLYMFLAAPGKWVKGTKMTFAGIKKPEERINLIAYLRSQGSTGYAIPAPDPSRAAGAAAPASGAAPATTPAADGKPATAETSAAAKPVAAGVAAKPAATTAAAPVAKPAAPAAKPAAAPAPAQ
jgi:cytochrome c